MTFSEILNFKIIYTENIILTPYHFLLILVILIVTRVAIKLIKKVLDKLVIGKKLDFSRSYTFYQILKYIIWIIAITISLDLLGVKMTILVAGSAALFIGLGLGLQQIFKDMVSGIMLMFEENLNVGHVVELDGIVGRVLQIGLRTSKIRTRDNIIMSIPNSKFITETVINWNDIEELTRFNVEVSVAYSSDVDVVKKVLLECVEEIKEISFKRKPFVRLNNFGDSSLDFQLFFWTKKTFEVENVKSEVRFLIVKKFRENKIEIPFPQQDLHFKSIEFPFKKTDGTIGFNK